jgi:hypothetical protein
MGGGNLALRAFRLSFVFDSKVSANALADPG